jgi:hypothetical protein|tara:strand:+ start:478 stop:693 length:216 start_codon:yes stop_codon:yes gene_type:complete
MINPLEQKRRGYLNFFKDGVADALLDGVIDDNKRSSAYYKQGYDFGLTMWSRILENNTGIYYEKESQDNGE